MYSTASKLFKIIYYANHLRGLILLDKYMTMFVTTTIDMSPTHLRLLGQLVSAIKPVRTPIKCTKPR
jgi:hypothetical protein